MANIATSPSAGSSPSSGTGSFVGRSGTYFTLNGCKFFFEGVNNYYMTYYDAASVTSLLDAAQSQKLRVLRIWAFIDQDPKGTVVFQTFGPHTIHTDQLKSLDFVVSEAGKRGLKLILVLTNNWAEFGGVDAYVKGLGGTYHDDFFSQESIKSVYKQWVQTLVQRTNVYTNRAYKDDTTIMAWELINEIRCRSSGELPVSNNCNIQLTTAWVKEMCEFIKGLDSNHMVSVGDEGFLTSGGSSWPYSGSEGVDTEQFMMLDCIDFGTAHMYVEAWGVSDQPGSWGVQWIEDHAALGKKIGKPVLLEEYSSSTLSARGDLFSMWHNAILSCGLASGMVWMIAGSPAIPDYDGYTVYASGAVQESQNAVTLLSGIASTMAGMCTC